MAAFKSIIMSNGLRYEFNPAMAVSKQINKLTLNVKKTKCMLIGSQFKLSQINSDFTVWERFF